MEPKKLLWLSGVAIVVALGALAASAIATAPGRNGAIVFPSLISNPIGA